MKCATERGREPSEVAPPERDMSEDMSGDMSGANIGANSGGNIGARAHLWLARGAGGNRGARKKWLQFEQGYGIIKYGVRLSKI